MCQGLGHKRYNIRSAMERWHVVADRRKVKRMQRKGFEMTTSRTRFGRVALSEAP